MRDPRLIEFAKQMRREMTAPEQRLGLQLRAKRLNGAKFRREQVIGSYIADFACRSPMLIVEIDGETHADREQWARCGRPFSQSAATGSFVSRTTT